MAPVTSEQAKGKSVDKRADIWSFGVVLYEMLTGERLFKGDDAAETLAQVLTKQPDLDRVPPQARKLLDRCLQKDTKQRLRDIGYARDLLIAQPVLPAASRPRFSWAMATVLLAFIAASLGWIAWRAMRPSERQLMQLSADLGPDYSLALSAGGSIALSPDGKLLAFIVRGADGQTHLATRRIDQSQISVLKGTVRARGPSFPPMAAGSPSRSRERSKRSPPKAARPVEYVQPGRKLG